MGNWPNKLNTLPVPPPIPEQSIYSKRNWKPEIIRRAMLSHKLAPIYKGSDEQTSSDQEECPICFLFYEGGLNRTKCCRHGICTECFLQVRPHWGMSFPKVKCPFCNCEDIQIVYTGPLSQEEKQVLEREKEQVLELQRKMRQEEIEQDRIREEERKKKKEQQEEKIETEKAIQLSLSPQSQATSQPQTSSRRSNEDDEIARREAEETLKKLVINGDVQRTIEAIDAIGNVDSLTDEQQIALAILRSLHDSTVQNQNQSQNQFPIQSNSNNASTSQEQQQQSPHYLALSL